MNLRTRACAVLVVTLGLLIGCASPSRKDPPLEFLDIPENSEADHISDAMHQIATDFTDVLVQVDALQPSDTVLLWSEVLQFAGPFSSVLKSELAAAGYELLPSDDRDDEHAVGYFMVKDAFSEDGVSGTYIVSVGDIQFTRSYRLLEGESLAAVSDMTARGTDMTRVRLDQSALPTVMLSSLGSTATSDENARIADNQVMFEGVQNLLGLPADSEPLLNLFNVHEEILSFPRESLALTHQSRALLQVITSQFDPATDVVVLVGCSQGESERENGNAELAIARARIASGKLQIYGVPERNIFDAGCWADVLSDPRFPQRGVVVTLKREVG